ncbi:MAG: class II fructose-bisphosphate aldolase [Brevinema sp.]
MLVTLNQLFENEKKYGTRSFGSFNVHSLEMILPFFSAAVATRTPIIIQTSTGTAKYIGFKLLKDVVDSLSESTGIDICLHLDHCTKFDTIKEAIKNGFSSVMIDGSALPLEENIKLTREVAEYAHAKNVSVEGEIGTIGGTEEGKTVKGTDIMYTSPDEALYFVEQTHVDALAISIGTAHGLYKAKAVLNLDKLKEIQNKVATPLVLHGGTGVSDLDMKQCIQLGIRKVNVGTEFNGAWIETAQKTFSAGKFNNSLRDLLIPANKAVESIMIQKINLISH